MYHFFTYAKALRMRLRGLLLTWVLRCMGCTVGGGLRAAGWPVFRLYPKGNVHLGKGVTLGRDVTFEIDPGASLRVGNHVFLSDRVVLSTLSEITLGDWVSIAENTGIRGAFHQLAPHALAVQQPSDTAPIRIDRGVGIGANAVVMMGVHLPEGAIIGANTVVLRGVTYLPNGIYAGAPARLIRMR